MNNYLRPNDNNFSVQELKNALTLDLPSIKNLKMPMRIYEIVRIAIRELKLPPGVMLLERELAEVLEVSRTPIREALVRLEGEKLIKLIPRRGFKVEPINLQDLKEIYTVLESLEGLACELATVNIDTEGMEQL